MCVSCLTESTFQNQRKWHLASAGIVPPCSHPCSPTLVALNGTLKCNFHPPRGTTFPFLLAPHQLKLFKHFFPGWSYYSKGSPTEFRVCIGLQSYLFLILFGKEFVSFIFAIARGGGSSCFTSWVNNHWDNTLRQQPTWLQFHTFCNHKDWFATWQAVATNPGSLVSVSVWFTYFQTPVCCIHILYF